MKILLPILCLFLASCSHHITTSTNTVEKDSSSVKVVHHRDTVRIHGDTVVSIMYVTKRDTIIKERRGRAELDIIKKNGITTTKCKCDSVQKALDIAISDTTRYKTKTITITKAEQIEYIPKFYKFCLWWFIATVAIAGLYTGLKLKGKLPFI